MSTPQSEERRLGLLQCPKAASRGWGSSATTTNAVLDDRGEDRHHGNEVENRETLLEVAQNDPSNVVVHDVGEVESCLENADAPDAHVATANEPSEPAVNLENNESPVEPVYDSHADKNDEAAAPRKRIRVNEGYDECGKDASNIPSCTDVLERTLEENLSEPLVHKNHEGKAMTSSADLSYIADEELKCNPIDISLDYESKCHCSYCISLASSPQNEESTRSTSCTNVKGQILTITPRINLNKVETVINVGAISGRAKLELLPRDITDCAQDQSMRKKDNEMNVDVKDTACHDLALDVFGYRLSRSCKIKSIEVHRPDWMNALPLSLFCPAVLEGQDFTKELRIRVQSLRNEEEATKDDSSYYSSHPEESYKLTIYPQTEQNSPGFASERKSGVTFISDPWRNAADKIVHAIQRTNGSKEATTLNLPSNYNRIFVCGAKGVGKSTFLRYMTNRMLSMSSISKDCSTSSSSKNRRCVAILDLDSGQPEFHPPGLLTLSIVSTPIMSDPPMHMVCNGIGRIENGVETLGKDSIVEKVVASYFFGDVTSKSDPDTYIHMANKLLQKYQDIELGGCEQSTGIPLIVNSDGWVKGLGYEILSALVGICNPAHIVQILGNTKAKSFDMTPFQGENGNLHAGRSIYAVQSFDEYASTSLEDGKAFRRRGSLDSSQFSTGPLLATASDHRSHRICAYFLQGCDKMSALRSGIVGDDTLISFHKEKGLVDPSNVIGLALSSMFPYAVPFESVRLYPSPSLLDSTSEIRPLWGSRADLACSDVLDSLAGAIVGLCCEPDQSDITSNIVNCNAGCGVPVLPCAGLGIIRSIDHARRIFYVLTPVHPNLLSGVASFVGGYISLPLECVYRGIYSDFLPYLSFGQVVANPGLGSEVMKSRNHSGRKK
ncbi:hypothetical protein HJC23_010958 [Cyclotella cryptica]|uniref:Uncharacterized protein n=1 Tax=Cyclotella cryptica TaxID=29204 RepID=A0ABD3NT88_9STRA|eukprot:CCRYP_020088-RA/>CCRYP_020088-RA protein AED:0.00 eAED:0.00 QI:187/-1/1/1/-1/1/1/484/894